MNHSDRELIEESGYSSSEESGKEELACGECESTWNVGMCAKCGGVVCDACEKKAARKRKVCEVTGGTCHCSKIYLWRDQHHQCWYKSRPCPTLRDTVHTTLDDPTSYLSRLPVDLRPSVLSHLKM